MLEKVVRPFQLSAGSGPRVLPPEQAPDDRSNDPIEITWGRDIAAEYRPYSDTLLSFEVVNRWSETSRVTNTVRVSNPEDESQYVDVERIREISLRNQDSGKEQTWSLDN